MRFMKWVGVAAAILLTVACFMPWVVIHSINSTVSGVDSTGTNFGKPGYFHFIAIIFFLVFTITPKVWAKRSNLLVGALNMAWAIRNYFIISLCRGGDCPEKKIAIYLVVIASVLVLLSCLLPDYKTNRNNPITEPGS